MYFLRSLKSLIKEKTLAKINFDSGDVEIGFVVYADQFTFDMYVRDNVFNQSVLDEDMNGMLMLEEPEDAEGIDFVFVKGTYKTEDIVNIVSDASHHFPVDVTPFFDLVSQGIYENLKNENKQKKTKSDKSQSNKKLKEENEIVLSLPDEDGVI